MALFRWQRQLQLTVVHLQAHVAFQLGSVAAARAVTATRACGSGGGRGAASGGRAPRDLLVLHTGGQLAVYVGRQRMFDVQVAAPPPGSYPGVQGGDSGHTGGPRRRLLLLDCNYWTQARMCTTVKMQAYSASAANSFVKENRVSCRVLVVTLHSVSPCRRGEPLAAGSVGQRR